MGLETGNFVSSLDRQWPLSSDMVSEGDNHLQLIKRALQYSFPMGKDTSTVTSVGPDQAVQVIIAKPTEPDIDTSASGHADRAMGMVWLDTTLNLVKIRNQANSDWITLPFDPEVSSKIVASAGTLDGVVIGGTTPAAITGTTLKGDTSLELATGATVTGIDNGALGSSATLLATQGAIKTYVDAQVTAQDLDLISDSGTIDIDLDGDSLTVAGGTGLATAATGTTLTINGEDATTSAKGIASFSSDHFSVSSGAVSIATDSIDDTLIDFGTGTNQVSTADVPEETNLYYTNTRADARIAAASIADLNDVSITGLADDEILRYDATSGTWENVLSETPDQLSVKGDVLAYNSGVDPAAEQAYHMPDPPASINGYVLTADTTKTYGFEWQAIPSSGDPAGTAVAMAIALG